MPMFRVAAISMMMMAAAGCAWGAAATAPIQFDVVIAHGRVLDGTGSGPYDADVGVRDGYVVAVGDLSRARAGRRLEARGLFVTPGFINIHDHATKAGLHASANMLTQGVTTE